MHVYLRGGVQQRLRLASGFVLFAFATTHFLNHALGLISLEVMHEAQVVRTAITRSLPGTIVLSAALVTHIVLALYKLGRRRTWRMPKWEALQIGLGLAIPFFLFPHIVNTRIAHVFFNVEDSYLYELVRLWPESAVVQSSLLLMVWAHGCLGLHYWLRLSDGHVKRAPILLIFAIAVPVLALAGFAVGGRTTGDIMSDPQALAALKARSHWPNAGDSATLAWLRTGARITFYAMVAATITYALARRFSQTLTRRAVRVTYASGPTLDLAPGKTLLEASRQAGIPHASVCGGRGRCSTCRVRIESGLEQLPAAGGAEAITLKSIDAPANVRLACQLKPTADLTVALLSNPAIPGPPQEDFVETKELIAAHVRAILADEVLELRSSDEAAVIDWIADNVPYAAPLASLSAPGFVLQGARIEYLFDRPTAAIIYQRQERLITLFARPVETWTSFALRGQRNGYHVLAWAEGNLAYIAVSDLTSHQLELLETALRAGTSVLKVDARTAVA